LKKNKEYELSPEKYFYLNNNLKLSLITGNKLEIANYLEKKNISLDDFEAYYQTYEFEISMNQNSRPSNQMDLVMKESEEGQNLKQVSVLEKQQEGTGKDLDTEKIIDEEPLNKNIQIFDIDLNEIQADDQEIIKESLYEIKENKRIDDIPLELATPNLHINEEFHLPNLMYPDQIECDNNINFYFQENDHTKLIEQIESVVDDLAKNRNSEIIVDNKKESTSSIYYKDDNYEFMDQIHENNLENFYDHQEGLPINKEYILDDKKEKDINIQHVEVVDQEEKSKNQEEKKEIIVMEKEISPKDDEKILNSELKNDMETLKEDSKNIPQLSINNQLYNSELIEQKLKDSGILNNSDYSIKEVNNVNISITLPNLTPTSKKSSKKSIKAKDMLQSKRIREEPDKFEINTDNQLLITPNNNIEVHQAIKGKSIQKTNKKLPPETPIIINKEIPEIKKNKEVKEKEIPKLIATPVENITNPETKTKLILIDYTIDSKTKKKLKSINCEVELSQHDWDLLISEKLSKNTKILMAINNRKPILTPNWLFDSLEKKKLMPYDTYFIKDKDYEKKYNFDFGSLMKEAPYASYMEGYSFYVTEGVFNKDDIEEIIHSAGGEIFQSYKGKKNRDNFFIIADKTQDKEEIKLLKPTGAYQLYSSDFITESVYTQSLEMKNKYKL
jgi:hypothetical protein